MKKRIGRRDFLKSAATTMAAFCASCIGRPTKAVSVDPTLAPVPPIPVDTQTPAAVKTDTQVYMPAVMTSTPPPAGSRVVYIHSPMVTSWDYGADWYGNYVNQDVVNTMVDEGITRLTGYTQVSQAWNALLPGYTPGKAIAIKVNLNNSDCGVSNNLIDALIDPVNALIRGMKQIGVVENDIWIFDAIRVVPARMKNRCLYPGVRFLDNGCSGNSQAGFTSTHPDATIHFSHSALSDRKVTDVLVNASYVINVPVLKDHGISAVTLGFKNHYGSINQIIKTPTDSLHTYIDPGNAAYSASYSPLVEIYNNPNIHNKTRLVVGDGLIGAFGGTTNDSPPVRWSSFGNAAANSLFFSLDPVAVECVMFDVLSAEPGYHPQRGPNEDNHLRLASQAGLGVYERGDPWAGGYTAIEYQKIELS